CSMRPSATSWSSRDVRSCIRRCAFCGSSQSFGSSASLFSSARRARALSTSKMPPQQPDRLLDLIDQLLDFRAHDMFRRPGDSRRAREGCSDPAMRTQPTATADVPVRASEEAAVVGKLALDGLAQRLQVHGAERVLVCPPLHAPSFAKEAVLRRNVQGAN